MTLHLSIDTTNMNERADADMLRDIAQQIDTGGTGGVVSGQDGEPVGSWSCVQPERLPMIGEELVVAYVAWVDNLWVADPGRVKAGYCLLDVHDDESQRQATIMDTDMVPPSRWTFRDAFVAHLKRTGQYAPETAAEFLEPQWVF